MRSISLLACLALLSSLAAAQSSNTLPSGWDTKEGVTVGSTSGSNYFAGWDILSGSTRYNPSRVALLYSNKTFPWGRAAKTITKLTARRDGTFISGSTTAHTKEVRMILSTSNQPVHAPDRGLFDGNHGKNKIDVIGSKGKPKTINYPATPAPGSGRTAPFNTTFAFDRPFVVPANSQTLVIEYRTYKVSVSTGRWRADSVTYPGTNFNGGAFSVFYSTHCLNPRTFYTWHSKIIGTHYSHIWRNGTAGGKTMVGWLGTRNSSGIKVPGTGSTSIPQCEWWITPIILAVDVTGPVSGGGYLVWGEIPNDRRFVGAKVSHQSFTLDPQINKLGLGITRAIEDTIGTGYDPSLVLGTQVYSYGANTGRYTSSVNPDDEPNGRFFFRRVVIFNVN